MDSKDPPRSLRTLASRHRWPNGLPPVVSLRLLAMRHDHPQTTTHRLLALNTYLMPGFQLSLCNVIHIGRMIPVLGSYLMDWLRSGLPVDELIDQFHISADMLADAFDISKDMLVDAFPDIAHSFVKSVVHEVTKWIPGGWIVEKITDEIEKPIEEVAREEILGKLSARQLVDEFAFMTPDQIVAKLGLDAGQVAAAFCNQFAAWLSEATGWPINFTWITIGEAAPNREMRAQAIGRMLADDYDIAGLCEVWEPERQADLLQAAAGSGRETSGHLGPEADGEIAGSGLLTVTFDGRSTSNSDAMRVFTNQGDYVQDADAWSHKGVQLTVVTVGVGTIDLYTTHLYEGDEALVDPTAQHRWDVKLSQIKQVVEFIGDTRSSNHVVMLLGDFNVAAHEPQYTEMKDLLATVGLRDLWPFWHQLPEALPDHHGATNDTDLCELGVADDPFCTEFATGTTPPFCAEPGQKEDPTAGRRIDYIFVEKPRADHPFTIDFTRIRRRGDQFEGSPLSDHLGLDVKLIVSPPVHLPA